MLVEEDQAEVALQMDVKNKNLKIKKKKSGGGLPAVLHTFAT